MVHRKILFFCDAPESISPSTQVNARQFRDFLYEHGWDLEILPPASSRTTELLKKVKGLHWLYCRLLLPMLRRWQFTTKLGQSHIVIVHKTISQIGYPPNLESKLRKKHNAIIFNFDDAINEAGFDYLDKRIELSDAVWVGNEQLKRYSEGFSKNVNLIRSAVDTDYYSAKSTYNLHPFPRLIWCGTPYSFKYLELLEKPLSNLSKSLDFKILLVSREKFQFCDPKIQCEWIPYSKERELESLKESDVALMPLTDGVYERAKENYKVKMYLSIGLPTICSPVGINNMYIKENENGLFATSEKEWEKQIKKLLYDEGLRERIGTAGRTYIEQNYSIPIIGEQIIELFESLLNRARK